MNDTATMNDTDLRMALAKMLPDKVAIENDLSGYGFIWCEPDKNSGECEYVKDSEWLLVCQLAEQTLSKSEMTKYADILCDDVNIGEGDPNIEELISLSWQRRAKGLRRVKERSKP